MAEARSKIEDIEYSEFICDVCKDKKVFYTLNQLQEHMSDKHPTPETFVPSMGSVNGRVRED